MKITRLIKYDLKCGFAYNRIKFIIAFVFILANCVYFNMITEGIQIDNVSLGDLIIFFFKGEAVFSSKTGNFPIPITYLGFQIIVAILIGYYPYDDINGYGKQIFIRCQDKKKWLTSKVAWSISTVLLFYFCTYIILILFSLVSGFDMSFEYHKEILMQTNNIEIPNIESTTIIVNGILMPIVYSMVVSLIQICISLGTNAIIGFLTTMIYAFVAVFFTSKFFLSNYIMILRNTEYSTVKYDKLEGFITLIIVYIFAILMGRLIINKKQLI